jgi:hypothetical protein
MRLTTKQSRELLEEHGCYVNEACEKCGRLLGAVRFTRHGESGVWCSRECRDGPEARSPGICKACRARLPEGKRRGTLYCDDACRKSAARSRNAELSRTNRPTCADFRIGFKAARQETPTALSSAQKEAILA